MFLRVSEATLLFDISLTAKGFAVQSDVSLVAVLDGRKQKGYLEVKVDTLSPIVMEDKNGSLQY